MFNFDDRGTHCLQEKSTDLIFSLAGRPWQMHLHGRGCFDVDFSVTLRPLVPGQTFMHHMKDIPQHFGLLHQLALQVFGADQATIQQMKGNILSFHEA